MMECHYETRELEVHWLPFPSFRGGSQNNVRGEVRNAEAERKSRNWDARVF